MADVTIGDAPHPQYTVRPGGVVAYRGWRPDSPTAVCITRSKGSRGSWGFACEHGVGVPDVVIDMRSGLTSLTGTATGRSGTIRVKDAPADRLLA